VGFLIRVSPMLSLSRGYYFLYLLGISLCNEGVIMIDFASKDPGAMNGGNGGEWGTHIGEWLCETVWPYAWRMIVWAVAWVMAGVLIRAGFDIYGYLAKLI